MANETATAKVELDGQQRPKPALRTKRSRTGSAKGTERTPPEEGSWPCCQEKGI
jgi:hypothetical protein